MNVDDKKIDFSIDAEGMKALGIVAQEIIKSKKSEILWRRVKIGAVVTILGLAMMSTAFNQFKASEKNNVQAVRIDGTIGIGNSSADAIIPALKKAFKDKNSKAIILSIDSPGGSPSDADRINQTIENLKAETKKPVIAIIDGVGASASYMIAIHADKIIAGKYSLIGSIGVIIQSWDYHVIMDKVGVKQRVFASGELKNMLNPYAEMTPAAEVKAQEIVNRMASTFVLEVKKARGKKLKEGNWFTGEVWPGEEALAIGLIDEVGVLENYVKTNFDDAKIVVITPNVHQGFMSFNENGFSLIGKAMTALSNFSK